MVLSASQSIGSLRTGLVVNWAFIALTAAFMASVTFASGRQSDARARGVEQLRLALYNLGFAAYLSAGSAFFGAFSFARSALSEHKEFVLIWSFGLLLVVSVQLVQSRLDADSPMVKSRIVAIIFGVVASAWAWHGACDTILVAGS